MTDGRIGRRSRAQPAQKAGRRNPLRRQPSGAIALAYLDTLIRHRVLPLLAVSSLLLWVVKLASMTRSHAAAPPRRSRSCSAPCLRSASPAGTASIGGRPAVIL